MLQLKGITKTFFARTPNERVALSGIDLELREGDFVTVIGSNGAGKSTLLNIVAGNFWPDQGTVVIDGSVVTRDRDFRRARHVSRVFQDPMAGTAAQMTIAENLAMALARGKSRRLRTGVTKAKLARFREELATLELGLENRMSAKVGLLSGGQRQALSLLMATFSKPRILLLDEHTAALDPQRSALVSRLTVEAVARHGLTTLMVTHNMEQALSMGDRLIMMHEGKILSDLSPEQKAKSSVADLLAGFDKLGAAVSDRTLLA